MFPAEHNLVMHLLHQKATHYEDRLAPPIVEAIMTGKAPNTLSLAELDTNRPFSWQEQLMQILL